MPVGIVVGASKFLTAFSIISVLFLSYRASFSSRNWFSFKNSRSRRVLVSLRLRVWPELTVVLFHSSVSAPRSFSSRPFHSHCWLLQNAVCCLSVLHHCHHTSLANLLSTLSSVCLMYVCSFICCWPIRDHRNLLLCQSINLFSISIPLIDCVIVLLIFFCRKLAVFHRWPASRKMLNTQPTTLMAGFVWHTHADEVRLFNVKITHRYGAVRYEYSEWVATCWQ